MANQGLQGFDANPGYEPSWTSDHPVEMVPYYRATKMMIAGNDLRRIIVEWNRFGEENPGAIVAVRGRCLNFRVTDMHAFKQRRWGQLSDVMTVMAPYKVRWEGSDHVHEDVDEFVQETGGGKGVPSQYLLRHWFPTEQFVVYHEYHTKSPHTHMKWVNRANERGLTALCVRLVSHSEWHPAAMSVQLDLPVEDVKLRMNSQLVACGFHTGASTVYWKDLYERHTWRDEDMSTAADVDQWRAAPTLEEKRLHCIAQQREMQAWLRQFAVCVVDDARDKAGANIPAVEKDNLKEVQADMQQFATDGSLVVGMCGRFRDVGSPLLALKVSMYKRIAGLTSCPLNILNALELELRFTNDN